MSTVQSSLVITGQVMMCVSMCACSNWGTENDPDFKYCDGNSEGRGFGKILNIIEVFI